ncbi:DUF6279 family lipoprotein [Rhodoferax ferrireducens]|uniref:DUF6279 family lipoprotein n=1 Tax=Rhodoferax ferrireducens TaxID=192843 RepID=UPI000E0CF3FF|nr:DUF6279 family lipoprotein [Rhodoferax ferrireducens]
MTVFNRPPNRVFQGLHIIGSLLGLFLALLLSGCSAVKLGYNNAPELGYWWLDSYLDFNDRQSVQVRADLAALQAWHRQTELPLYVSTLQQLQRMAPSDVTPAQVCEVSAGFRSRFQALLDQAEPALSTLASTLHAEQLDHLARQFDKRNQKWRAEWIDASPTERSAQRVKRRADRAEMFYGPLEEPQRAVVRDSTAVSAFDARLNDREAVRRQQDTLQTLRQIQTNTLTGAQIRTAVHALLARATDSPDAAYQTYMEKTGQENCLTMAKLHNSTTPAQRLKVMETLKAYETDALALMVP